MTVILSSSLNMAQRDIEQYRAIEGDTHHAKPSWQQRLGNCVKAVATPLNSVTMGRGRESFVPLPLHDELVKAARILQSFSYHSKLHHPCR
jgi:hypothetical protein